MSSWSGAPVGACMSGAGAASSTLAAALQFFAASQCLLRGSWPPQATEQNGSHYDVIVVGGGTAGSVLAARLSEVPHINVLLLEAGGDPPRESIIPQFRFSMMNTQYDWNFTSVDDHYSSQALNGATQRLPQGKLLGGTGSINDMVYTRGFPVDYDEWAASLDGAHHWGWANVLKYFKKTEHLTDENIIHNPDRMRYHSVGGEIEVSGSKEQPFDTEKFLESFKEMGFNLKKDMTFPDKIGAGRFSHTIRRGMRDSTLTALLNAAGVRDNLHVIKNAFVTKILMKEDTAYGVQVLTADKKELRFYAKNEVVVSAGTYNTPKLLLLSGIGPKEHLKEMGIKVVKDLPVGKNLHDHTMVLSYLAADNGTCYTDEPTKYFNMIRYVYNQTGDYAVNNGVGAYLSLGGAGKHHTVPDFAFYPVCTPINSGFYEPCLKILGFTESICSTLDNLNKNHELMSIAVVLMKPSSRGKVTLSSKDPLEAPRIFTGSFSDPSDLDGYPEAMSVVERLAETKYFKQKGARLVEIDIEECAGKSGGELVKCRVRALAMSAWHPVGTAAMGAVVDAQLRVLGVKGLRVVDASIMPKIVRGNTNAPVVMIAEQASDFIKKDNWYK